MVSGKVSGLVSIIAALALGSGCTTTLPPLATMPVADHTYSRKNLSSITDYVTPKDPAVVEFLDSVEVKTPEGIYNAMQTAGLKYALSEHDMKDYTGERYDPELIHGIQFPSETLKNKEGDCKDFTVLYCSVLQAAGFDTTIVMTEGNRNRGHILMMYDTGMSYPDYKKEKEHNFLSSTCNGIKSAWVPVNVSQLEKKTFDQANSSGMYFCVASDSPRYFQGKKGFFPVNK